MDMRTGTGNPLSPVMPAAGLESSIISKSSRQSSVQSSFMKELDKIHEQQSAISQKLLREKMREQQLKKEIQENEKQLKSLQAETGNGNVVKTRRFATAKRIAKMEKQVVITRNKLSCSRTDNALMKSRIDGRRKDKNLILRIFHETELDLAKTQRGNDDTAALINELHEKKHRVQMDLQGIKDQMVKSMENFSRELDTMKETIEYNQNSLLEGIRDKLLHQGNTMRSSVWGSSPRAKSAAHTVEQPKSLDADSLEEEIKTVLAETGVESPEELRLVLDQDENLTFGAYRDVQDQTEEVENLETEVKHLEEDLGVLNSKAEELEQSNLRIHKDLESHIASIQNQIAKLEAVCKTNGNVIATLSESFMNLLRNIANEEDGIDQQLLQSGINERNIVQFLGVIEDRIDYAIQMSRAAAKIHLNTGDFKTARIPVRKSGRGLVPSLPTLQDPLVDDDEADTDDLAKLRPVNIDALKDFMIKKVNKLAAGAESTQPISSPRTFSKGRTHDGTGQKKTSRTDTSLDLSSASIIHGGTPSAPKSLRKESSAFQGGRGARGVTHVKKQ